MTDEPATINKSLKVVIRTPSCRHVSFADDEKVRYECDEAGEHWLMLCVNDGTLLYKEKHDLLKGMVLNAKPAKEWELSLYD